MNEILKVVISAEIDDLKKEINKAKSEVDGFAKDSESGFSKAGDGAGKAGKGIKAGMAVAAAGCVAAVAAIVQVGQSLLQVAEDSKEFLTNSAKVKTAFEVNNMSATEATNAYRDFYSVMGDNDAAAEAVQLLSHMATNEQDVDKWFNIAAGSAGMFGDSIPIESLMEASNESAKTGKVTGVLADAYNWANVSVEDLSASLGAGSDAQAAFNEAIAAGATKEDAMNAALAACNSEMERQELIADSLNGITAESAALFKEHNAAVIADEQATFNLNAAMAALGEAIMPLNTLIKEIQTSFVEAFTPAIGLISEGLVGALNGATGAATNLATGVDGLLDGIVTIVTNSLAALSNALPVILVAVAELIPMIVETLLTGIPQIIAGAI